MILYWRSLRINMGQYSAVDMMNRLGAGWPRSHGSLSDRVRDLCSKGRNSSAAQHSMDSRCNRHAGKGGRGLKLTTHLHLVRRWVNGSVPPLHRMPSWRVQGQLVRGSALGEWRFYRAVRWSNHYLCVSACLPVVSWQSGSCIVWRHTGFFTEVLMLYAS